MQPDFLKAKKKRLLMLAVILAVPILVISIALYGLLRPHNKHASPSTTGSAFNTELPGPNLPKREKNKLEIYMQAQQDSIKQNAERAKDPYAAVALIPPGSPVEIQKPVGNSGSLGHTNPLGTVTSPFPDDNDKKVSTRIEKLYGLIGNSESKSLDKRPQLPATDYVQPVISSDVAKLQKLMQDYQKTDTAQDSQLNQVRQILDEIKEIQNPAKTKPLATTSPDHEQPLTVTANPVEMVDSTQESTQNGFFGLTDQIDTSAISNTPIIEAVVHADQTVQTGSIVKLRLLQPIYVSGQKIPANAFIYGPASLSGERVSIQLTNAIYDGHIYPISMKVYDGTDGLDGLYVPGMITRDVVKQNMSQGVSGMNIGSLDPSLGAQAATAAVETARNLMSRKIAIVKATLKAGHVAILKSASSPH